MKLVVNNSLPNFRINLDFTTLFQATFVHNPLRDAQFTGWKDVVAESLENIKRKNINRPWNSSLFFHSET